MLPLTFPTTVTSVKVDLDNVDFEVNVNCEAKDFETWLKEFESITKTNYTVCILFHKNNIKSLSVTL